ncbi:DUF6464 family protein [Leptothoe sp. PORK10 BA2]|uniref:DUF6464 family protein n=1 Tax=Leptothoe sp. PORK10 BA2 TaxID=3110254 RepID=UPI002B20E4A8|nr:DUF6464 family protein [Leptothoe sp. PORK10 BA2]MEA5465775.1 DUF6464 family protein [Leptothoe sp. PORK10 BA2]
MAIVVFLILVGLLPPALSLWATYRAERRVIERFDLVVESGRYAPVTPWRRRHPDEHYVDGLGLVIGDITCQLNARSPHIRCAVNPTGPCDGCRSYEGRIYDLPIKPLN